MIVVTIQYPNDAGCTFDFDYYCSKHMPMVKEKMAGACSHFTIEKGLSGAMPAKPPTYVAVGHLYFESVDSFLSAFGPHASAIGKDIPNYTNVKPVIQVSEVLVG